MCDPDLMQNMTRLPIEDFTPPSKKSGSLFVDPLEEEALNGGQVPGAALKTLGKKIKAGTRFSISSPALTMISPLHLPLSFQLILEEPVRFRHNSRDIRLSFCFH